jgi:hypothetical protein
MLIRLIGRYLDGSVLLSLPGFLIGMTFAVFHLPGKQPFFRHWLYIAVTSLGNLLNVKRLGVIWVEHSMDQVGKVYSLRWQKCIVQLGVLFTVQRSVSWCVSGNNSGVVVGVACMCSSVLLDVLLI